jgi:lipoprotein-anchoring transpeptidase ErfK/SrfK
MRLFAYLRAPRSVRRLPAAALLAAMLSPVGAEIAPAQTETTSIPEWGVTGSVPQTGLSAYTSGKAFGAANGQPAAEPSVSKILVLIDKPTQQMKVLVNNLARYVWDVSTGVRAYDTPAGSYAARSMNEMWYSRQWDDAPMPHAIFFTKKGHAIHGTAETQKLGRPASHGCVRLAPDNARTLFALVKEIGLKNTEIVLTGEIPSPKATVSHAGPRKKLKQVGAVANKGARSKPEIKPSRKSADARINPGDVEKHRRLSRREWMRLYYSGPPQASPAQDDDRAGRWRRLRNQ